MFVLLWGASLSQATCSYPAFISSTCGVCPLFCKACTTTTTCVSCQAGYRLEGSCVACATYCSACSSTACSACFDGFFLAEGVCATCPANAQTCSQLSIGVCKAGYFSESFSCQPCEESKNCATCVSSLQCLSCQARFQLISVSNGVIYCLAFCSGGNPGCTSCQSFTVANGCVTCQVCSACELGFVVSGTGCLRHNAICIGNQFLNSGSCVAGGSLVCGNGATTVNPFSCINECPAFADQVLSTANSGPSNIFACQPKPLFQ